MSDYYTLITALPWLPELEQCRQLPLSRIALDQRLSMLSDVDKGQLQLVEMLYHPRASELEHLTDPEVVKRWKMTLQQVTSEEVRARIDYHLELRTLLAALRSRRSGLENASQFHGMGRWVPRIRKHWFEPLFGLEDVCPQLKQLERVLKKNEPMLLEKKLNQLLWQDLQLVERQDYFSFVAVACFVLRWGIAERHLQYCANEALGQFDQATATLLANCQLDAHLMGQEIGSGEGL